MKNKGQALTEFILVLPVMMLLVLGMIDFGNIIYGKYKLENDLDTIVDLYQNENFDSITTYANKQDVVANFDENNLTTVVRVSKKLKIYTPGLNKVLSSPYQIQTQREIYHES